MRKLFLVIFLIFNLSNNLISQNLIGNSILVDTIQYYTNLADTILPDTLNIAINDTIPSDSLILVRDTTEQKQKRDSINRIIFGKNDNGKSNKDSIKSNEEKYQIFIESLKDSLIFEKPDSVFYVAHKLDYFIDTNRNLMDDSTKRAINKLILLAENREAKKAIAYLQEKIRLSENILISENKTTSHLNDTILNVLKYLIQSIPEDSVKLSFTNTVNDSILMSTKVNDVDSIHLRLYDNRGEFVVLWIKKSDKNLFDIYLEDGVYLEKVREREQVTRKIDTHFRKPDLMKVKKVSLIIPIWKIDGSADIKFNQGYLESWAEGGESSMSALSVVKFSADYSYGKKRNLDTDVEYRLGYLKSGQKSLQKNDDKLEINAKYGKQAFNNVFYSVLLNFKTQFLKGYNYPNDSIPVSEFMSPAYLVFSLGMDYKPSDKFTFMVSPLASKLTIVADTVNYDQTRYGVGQNEKVRKEIGAYVKAISKIKFNENITLENKLNLFTNYTHNPQNVDLDWELDLKVKLNDYIRMSVNTHMIYDDDVEFPVIKDGVQIGITKKLQFKELFGIGFNFDF